MLLPLVAARPADRVLKEVIGRGGRLTNANGCYEFVASHRVMPSSVESSGKIRSEYTGMVFSIYTGIGVELAG